MSKRPLILFSGGLDSTWLIYNRVKDGNSVDTFYIDGGQSKTKIEAEKATRQLIENWLYENVKKDGNSFYIGEVSSMIPPRMSFSNGVKVSWCQPIAWLVSAMMVADNDRHSAVEVGYVMGDEICQHFHNLEAAWNALWAFTKRGEVVPLTFPLRMTSKAEILPQMPYELYKLTWVCELPISNVLTGTEACGNCVPCVTRALEEHRFFLKRGMSLHAFHTPSAKLIEDAGCKGDSNTLPAEQVESSPSSKLLEIYSEADREPV